MNRSVVFLLIVMMAVSGCVTPPEAADRIETSSTEEDARYFSPDELERRQRPSGGAGPGASSTPGVPGEQRDDASSEGPAGTARPTSPAKPSPTSSASPSATATATPTGSPSASPTSSPTPSPSPSPTSSPSSSPSPSPTSSPTASPTPTETADRVIRMGANVRGAHADYDPDPVTVSVGERVVWENLDSVSHTATSGSDFDTGVVRAGETSTPVVFDAPGTYTYYCRVHYETMRGATITVE